MNDDHQHHFFYDRDFGFLDEGAQTWPIGHTIGTLLGYAAHAEAIGRQRAGTMRVHQVHVDHSREGTAMKTIVRGAWAVIGGLLALVSLTWGQPGVTDSEILIGSCSALEGPANFLGTQTVLGARAYLNHVNEQGGVHGRKIKLVAYDDSYEPGKAIECFNRLKKEQVFAAGFFVGTPTGAKHAPMAESAKIPLIGLFTGAQLLHEPFRRYVINVRASYYDEAREQVDNLWNALGMRKIAVIYQDDAFGVAVLEGVKLALKKYNAAPVAQGSFPRNTLDVDSGIDLVRAANPEAVVMVGPYAPIAEIVKRGRAAGWNPLYLTVSFVGTEAFIKAAGKDGEGVVITQVVPPPDRTDLPAVALYHEALKQYFPEAEPNFVSLEGFVDAMVLVEGLKRAGRDLTREKLIDAIESIKDLDIGLGPQLKLTYGPQDHKGFETVYDTMVRAGQAAVFADWKELKQSL
jgi:branched-chain amino acid transport system substrate-binding protein